MRATINVSTHIQKALNREHPECFERFWDYVNYNEKYEASLMNLSVYSHSMSYEESKNELVEGNPAHVEYYRKMEDFYNYIYNTYEGYLTKIRGRKRDKLVLMKVLDSKRALAPKSFLASGHGRIKMLLPELDMLVCEAPDFFIIVSAPANVQQIIAKEAEVFGIHKINQSG